MVAHCDIDGGKRPSGGRPMSFRGCLKDDLETFEIVTDKDFGCWESLALCKIKWNEKVEIGRLSAIKKEFEKKELKSKTRHKKKSNLLKQKTERETELEGNRKRLLEWLKMLGVDDGDIDIECYMEDMMDMVMMDDVMSETSCYDVIDV